MQDSDSSTPPPAPTAPAVPPHLRERAFLVTNWWEMLKHAHEQPCMGKAMGYGGIGGVFTGLINRVVRSRTYIHEHSSCIFSSRISPQHCCLTPHFGSQKVPHSTDSSLDLWCPALWFSSPAGPITTTNRSLLSN
jgi:hypothetical protein